MIDQKIETSIKEIKPEGNNAMPEIFRQNFTSSPGAFRSGVEYNSITNLLTIPKSLLIPEEIKNSEKNNEVAKTKEARERKTRRNIKTSTSGFKTNDNKNNINTQSNSVKNYNLENNTSSYRSAAHTPNKLDEIQLLRLEKQFSSNKSKIKERKLLINNNTSTTIKKPIFKKFETIIDAHNNINAQCNSANVNDSNSKSLKTLSHAPATGVNKLMKKNKRVNSNLTSNFLNFKQMSYQEKLNYSNNLKDGTMLDFDFFVHEVQFFRPPMKKRINNSTGKKQDNQYTNSRTYKKSRNQYSKGINKKDKKRYSLKNQSKSGNKLEANKRSSELLKKKKKHTSSLFDIDNFVLHFSTKVGEKKERLNIPVPKFSLLNKDFYENSTVGTFTNNSKENSAHNSNRNLSVCQDYDIINISNESCKVHDINKNEYNSKEEAHVINSFYSNFYDNKDKVHNNASLSLNSKKLLVKDKNFKLRNNTFDSNNDLALNEDKDRIIEYIAKNENNKDKMNLKEENDENINNILTSNIINNEVILDTSDDYYLNLHSKFEQRERNFKLSYYAKKKNNEEDHLIIPCHIDFESQHISSNIPKNNSNINDGIVK